MGNLEGRSLSPLFLTFASAILLLVVLARVSEPVALISKGGIAREQQLWNAASNDEISTYNVGRHHSYDFVHKPFHRGRFLEHKRLEEEAATNTHHVISDPRDAENIFEPMKWMHAQGEPSAVSARKVALRARTQMLFFEPGDDVPHWNAAHNDAIKIGKSVEQKIADYARQADSQEVTENGTF